MPSPIRTVMTCLICLMFAVPALAADTPQDARKHTKLGKYVTAAEAYSMWKAAPDKIVIVDVRTPEEYDFVGHPDMAPNIPVQLWAGKFDSQKKGFPLADNPAFVDLMKQRYKADDALILMCRSGHRSAAAARKLIDAGFTNVYNMVDGFEGDKVADKASPDFGRRVIDGWRNAKGNPWTYDLDEKLAYVAK